MSRSKTRNTLVVVPSSLGWIALVGAETLLKQLTFGHRNSAAAAGALDPELCKSAISGTAISGTWNADLVRRLQAYASGTPVDFRDVRIDTREMTHFQRQVARQCRCIAYGQVRTYGQLAAEAGFPRAARAVGNCMAANRFPLVVPCHRVVPASGRGGAFSAPGGTGLKRRLLAMESHEKRCPEPFF